MASNGYAGGWVDGGVGGEPSGQSVHNITRFPIWYIVLSIQVGAECSELIDDNNHSHMLRHINHSCICIS